MVSLDVAYAIQSVRIFFEKRAGTGSGSKSRFPGFDRYQTKQGQNRVLWSDATLIGGLVLAGTIFYRLLSKCFPRETE